MLQRRERKGEEHEYETNKSRLLSCRHAASGWAESTTYIQTSCPLPRERCAACHVLALPLMILTFSDLWWHHRTYHPVTDTNSTTILPSSFVITKTNSCIITLLQVRTLIRILLLCAQPVNQCRTKVLQSKLSALYITLVMPIQSMQVVNVRNNKRAWSGRRPCKPESVEWRPYTTKVASPQAAAFSCGWPRIQRVVPWKHL